VFLTFVVILVTLVGQGLSLPALIRRLQISDGGADADEELRARLVATKAALAQIDALADEDWTRDETVERMRAWYEYRKRRLAARPGQDPGRGLPGPLPGLPGDGAAGPGRPARGAVGMRGDGKLSNETMNRILRELDLEESRLET
jgi:CPA1 family monovalent cation:H+ antiporter